jgi:cytoskeletal protein CcmA (bactofilin family)
VPGVYTFDRDINIATTVTFDGKDGSGNANSTSVFILRTSGSVKQAASIHMVLANGAQAKNIVWQVAGTVTVGAGATMAGVVLAKTAVAFITGSTLNGRILTQTACTLQSATIAVP